MSVFEIITCGLLPYLVWAFLLSRSDFHRVWSFSLSLLLASVFTILKQWPPWYTQVLVLITPLLSLFCVVISPAQKFMLNKLTRDASFQRLEWVEPKLKERHPIAPIQAESVQVCLISNDLQDFFIDIIAVVRSSGCRTRSCLKSCHNMAISSNVARR